MTIFLTSNAIRDVGNYLSEKSPKRHIYVIIEPPMSTITSSREQELFDQLTSLQELFNKSVYDTYMYNYIVTAKNAKKFPSQNVTIRKNFLRTKPLHCRVQCHCWTRVFKNGGAVLNFMYNGDRYSSRNDVLFLEMLRLLISKNNLKFTVFIETPSNCVNPKDKKFQAVVEHLMTSLKLLQNVTPLNMTYEMTKSIYSYCYLIVEVKRDNFMKGFVQASVQMVSFLTGYKCKANEIDNDQYVDKVFRIVTMQVNVIGRSTEVSEEQSKVLKKYRLSTNLTEASG
ncbi:hypothetical protein Glove_856g5 [Diversispora epigaea]|uniref:Uncharacterized protein n=1 Tax=Diversispora epigaea TaxID=1348612 RepID=A0A397G349_9GLOM|nr:hypothetical protein Glove_856g5 [Diversispora epigaea]